MGAMSLPQMAATMAGFAMRSTMAAIFAIAAAHALRDRDDYAYIVQAYRILPDSIGKLAAMLLPPLECGLALALLVPATRVFGSLATLATLACFTAAIAINLARGHRDIACGCGGDAGQKISWFLVLRNALLFIGLAASLWAPVHPRLDLAAYVGIAGLASFLAVLYLATHQLIANARAARV